MIVNPGPPFGLITHPANISDLYIKVIGAGGFRVRDTETLIDWGIGCKFDWIWENERPLVVCGVKLDGLEVTSINVEKINARESKYILLSCQEEVKWLREFPPYPCFNAMQKPYKAARAKTAMDEFMALSMRG